MIIGVSHLFVNPQNAVQAILRTRSQVTKKRNSYLGGHTVLTQHPGLRVRQLEIDAMKAQQRSARAQREYDKAREERMHQREMLIKDELTIQQKQQIAVAKSRDLRKKQVSALRSSENRTRQKRIRAMVKSQQHRLGR